MVKVEVAGLGHTRLNLVNIYVYKSVFFSAYDVSYVYMVNVDLISRSGTATLIFPG